jgi:hypothetical protein
MLRKIAYHLGFKRWLHIDHIVAPIVRAQNDLEILAAQSRERAAAALRAHEAHMNTHTDAKAWIAVLKHLKEA